MDNKSFLEAVDPEILQRVFSRRDAFKKGGLALAATSLPLAFAARAARAFDHLPAEVANILNFALTLERLEASFYNRALAEPGLLQGNVRDVFDEIAQNENAHVRLLESVLAAGAAPMPTFDFTAGGAFNPFGDYSQFLALSQGFEDLGVRAYKGQAPNLIEYDAILTTALQIHSVEARHAGVVRRIRGQQAWISGNEVDVPALRAIYAGEENTTQGGVDVAALISGMGDFPSIGADEVSEAFDEPLTMAQVLAIADPFIAG